MGLGWLVNAYSSHFIHVCVGGGGMVLAILFTKPRSRPTKQRRSVPGMQGVLVPGMQGDSITSEPSAIIEEAMLLLVGL